MGMYNATQTSARLSSRSRESAVVWTNDFLVFFLIFGKWPLKFWGGDLAKRLLGARAESAPRSLLSRSPQHQGVFCPDQKSQKLKFQVSFLGLNIALSPNLIGSSDEDFQKDSESGLNSKIKKTPRSLLSIPL